MTRADPRTVEQTMHRGFNQLRGLTAIVLSFLTVVVVATLIVILMAVVPGWPINRQGQESTNKAVGSINEVSILAAFCAEREDTLPEIRACVADGLVSLTKGKP